MVMLAITIDNITNVYSVYTCMFFLFLDNTSEDRYQSDHSLVTMAATKEIVWSKETYTTRTLLEKHADKFPLIVMVTRGYCGQDDIETLASQQVYMSLLIHVNKGHPL